MWFRVDDQLWSHPKTAALSDAALALWVRAGTYSSAHLTGGFIAAAVARRTLGGRPATIRELVTVQAGYAHGLWVEVDGGYRFHDWDDYQPDADAERARRDEISRTRAEAGRRGAESRWGHGKRDGKPDGKPMAAQSQTDGNAMAPSPSPSQESADADSSLSRNRLDELFERAWKAWPKRKDRKRALGKFTIACRKHDPEWLVGEIERFGRAYTETIEDVQFVPALDGWIAGERWTDDLPQPRASTSQTRMQQNLSVVERFAARESPGQRRDRELFEFMTAHDPESAVADEETLTLGEDGTWLRRP